jgi:hypothetical protein
MGGFRAVAFGSKVASAWGMAVHDPRVRAEPVLVAESEPQAGLGPRGAPPLVNQLMAAGNGAFTRFVWRCGPVPCDCDDEEREEYEQAHRSAHGPAPQTGPPPGFLDAVKGSGSGQGLQPAFRAEAEAKFGADFGQVRLHTDAPAAAAADQVSAHAFTIDRDVYFASGQYQPDNAAGRRLLAHELTHVVQGGGPRTSGAWVSHPSDPAERAAEAAADGFMSGQLHDVHAPATATVHRDPAPATAETPAQKVVRMIRDLRDREGMLRACMEVGGKWTEVEKAWQESKDPRPLLTAAMNFSQGDADGARVYAYLRFGKLRLADKLFFAGIGAGSDEETIYRLLPAIRADLGTTTTEFTNSYGVDGGDAYRAVYKEDKPLPNGTSSRIAGFLDDELSDEDLVKANALLVFGEVRPVDKIEIALKSLHISATDIMAALDDVHHGTPDGQVPPAESQYQQSYKRSLRPILSAELGEAGRNYARAKLILEGKYTPIERIKVACEAWVVDTQQIFDALGDASKAQLEDLKKQWDDHGEVRKLIEGKLTISKAEAKRIETFISGGGKGMAARLALLGVDVTDVQGVIQAALKNPEVGQAFAEEWPKKDEFYKQYTGNETIGAAMMWGKKMASSEWRDRLALAAELRSEEGVKTVLLTMVKTDADRASIRDSTWMPIFKDMSSWSSIEPLLAPRDDLAARSAWLKQRFKDEKGHWGDVAAAAAYEDEQRDLDAALAKAADPKNLTPEEKAAIAPVAGSTEAALNDFMQVRDQLDAVAIQVVGVAAGLLVTALTGGAAGPVTATLIAKVALAQACASVAAVWVVKGERTTGGEATRAFAVGAVSGATQLFAAGPIMSALSPAYREALAKESIAIATQVAEREFAGTGMNAMKSALEGAAAGAAGAAVDTGSKSETWRRGFIDGLMKTFEGAATGGVVGGASGAAASLLGAAVKAAKAGRVAEANQLMGQLEAQVSPEEAAMARSALNAEMQDALGSPPGTAKVQGEQAKLVAEGATHVDANTMPENVKTAEKQVVSKSEPQPSTLDGYVDEVDLGNGHKWRRRSDGTWCRFSTPSGCGTIIEGAPPVSPEAAARVKRTPDELVDRFLKRTATGDLSEEEALAALGFKTKEELRAVAAKAATDNELLALLSDRFERARIRAEAKRAGRADPNAGDEAIDEMNKLSANDLQAMANANKILPTAVELRMLQEVVDDVAAHLRASPEEAAKWLSAGELRESAVATAANFGKAVERAVAHRLSTTPGLDRFSHVAQRPFQPTPDIHLPPKPNAPLAADITTNNPAAIRAHNQRFYASFTELVTYPSLPPGWRFPPP